MAEIRFAHVGMGDCVCVNHVLAIIQNGSATSKRYQDNAKKCKKYIDATHGKTIKSFLLLDEGTVIASHIRPLTLQQRLTFPDITTDTGVERTPPARPYVEPMDYQDFLDSMDAPDDDIDPNDQDDPEDEEEYTEDDEDEDVSE